MGITKAPPLRTPSALLFNSILRAGLCVSLLSCSPSGDSPRALTVRDSAGIRITEHSLESLRNAPEWRLSSDASLELGVLEGPDPYRFYRIQDAALLGDHVWVMDGGSRELRAFRQDGTHVLSTGGYGQGPGEFQFPGGILPFLGDSLVVWDIGLRRASFFDSSGEFGRSVQIAGNFQNPSLVAAFPDGTFLLTDGRPAIPSSGTITEAPLFVVRYGADGLLVDSLGVFPMGRMAKIREPPGFALEAFGSTTSVAGEQETYWVGVGSQPEIRRCSLTGKPLEIVRWEIEDQDVRPEHVEAFFAEQLRDARDEESRRAWRRRHAETPIADRFPSLDRLLADQAGRIWVRQYRRPTEDGPNLWVVFHRDGRIAARINTPRDLQVRDAAEDFVLGIVRGNFDEEYIRLSEIQRTEQ